MSTAAPIWNPADYAANSAAQHAWARELIGRLHLQGDEHILDVGCGDGKVTLELARAVPRGSATGVDASPEMIRFARRTFHPSEFPNLQFEVMDARHLRPARAYDVVFSNAALHWVDDHPAFLRGAAQALRPGGRLLTSCGGKGNAQEVFLALRPELRLARWRPFFRRMETPYFFHRPEQYEVWLARFGFQARQASLVAKDVTYDGEEGFATWLRTTWLPYTQRLPEAMRGDFIAAVASRYVSKHPPDPQGRIHVRMVRLEIDAIKG